MRLQGHPSAGIARFAHQQQLNGIVPAPTDRGPMYSSWRRGARDSPGYFVSGHAYCGVVNSTVVSGKGRPVRSFEPYNLLRVLRENGVGLEVVGSCITGAPARDLDVVVNLDAANLSRLRSAMENIGLGDWRRRIDRLATDHQSGVISIHTVFGPIDLHPARRT